MINTVLAIIIKFLISSACGFLVGFVLAALADMILWIEEDWEN